MAKGKPPSWAIDAPELFLGLEFAFGAFFDLTGDRQFGMGMGPIPRSAIAAYAAEHELEDDEKEDLIHLIREMDMEYMAYSKQASDNERTARQPRSKK